MTLHMLIPYLSFVQPIVVSDYNNLLYEGHKDMVPDWLSRSRVSMVDYSKNFKCIIIYVQNGSNA